MLPTLLPRAKVRAGCECCLNAGVSRFFGGRRLRPLLSKKHKDLRFAFDHVFDETASQSEVFKHSAYSIIEGVLDGINRSIFAYGATGQPPSPPLPPSLPSLSPLPT